MNFLNNISVSRMNAKQKISLGRKIERLYNDSIIEVAHRFDPDAEVDGEVINNGAYELFLKYVDELNAFPDVEDFYKILGRKIHEKISIQGFEGALNNDPIRKTN
jgi:hypothetical protein